MWELSRILDSRHCQKLDDDLLSACANVSAGERGGAADSPWFSGLDHRFGAACISRAGMAHAVVPQVSAGGRIIGSVVLLAVGHVAAWRCVARRDHCCPVK
jgi:hypothetical protein